MNKSVTFAAAAFLLAGCTMPAMLGGFAGTSAMRLPPGGVSALKSTCEAGAPLLEVAVLIPDERAKVIADFLGGFCRPLLATGAPPPTVDERSQDWLQANFAGLRTLLR